MHPVRYSIVFPCHNEAPHIERLLRKAELAFAPLDHEIIVVADGCSDGTERVVRAFARHAPSVRLVTSSQRLGKGGAIRKGIAESRGEFVGFMDGDGEIDPSFMLVGFRTLAAGATDIVIGNRYGQGGSYRTTLSRHLTSRVYQAAIWILFGLQFHDTQAGMKAFTATAAKKLFAASNVDGYAFDIDVLMHAHWMGYRIEEVPMQQRFKGTSTISFKHVLEMIADTCGTYDRHARELRATGVAWYRIPTVLRSYAFYPFTSALEFALRAVIHKGR
jgi:glycosyltransferase involved in cell wall biosynthesis